MKKAIAAVALAIALMTVGAVPASATTGNIICSAWSSRMIKLQALNAAGYYISIEPGHCSQERTSFGWAVAFRVTNTSCWAESKWGTKYFGTKWNPINANYTVLTYETGCWV